MKAIIEISRELGTLRPPLRWHWFVTLWGPGQGGHIYAHNVNGYLTPIGCACGFLRHGLGKLIKAWCL